MDPVNLLVISPPGARHLSILSSLPPEAKTTVSNNPAELEAAAPHADVLLNCTGKGDGLRVVIPKAPKLQWVHSLAAGVEHQLIPELVDSPVPLTNARGVYKESLGEFVVGAALFFAKDFRRMIRNQEAGRWEQFDVDEISRQTMGIIGYGEIGRAAAQRAKTMGMRVLGTRRNPASARNDGIADQISALSDVNDMIGESDVVVLAAPLTPETRGLVGDAQIRRMKRTAILVNVGRGPVVDEPALVAALREKRIRGAALDVFNEEPLPPEHPYWSLDNLLLSPHCADHTSDWLEQGMQFFISNFRRFLAGEPLLNIVDKRAGY